MASTDIPLGPAPTAGDSRRNAAGRRHAAGRRRPRRRCQRPPPVTPRRRRPAATHPPAPSTCRLRRSPAVPAETGWKRGLAGSLAFVRRRMTGDYQVDDFGYDPDFTDHVIVPPLKVLYEKWFRIETLGMENIPDTGGALLVANHSGTVAVDALMTAVALREHHPSKRPLRMLGADLVFQTPFLGSDRPQGRQHAGLQPRRRTAAVASGELVAVFPEGFKGVGKPYSQRYKLQRFGRGGFVTAAVKTGVPIIPVSIVGAEEIYPLIGNIKPLARALGFPYFPVTPTFPLLGPLGAIPLPSKWIIEFGEPIPTDEYAENAADDPMVVFNLTDRVRETIQQTLYRLLLRRGHPVPRLTGASPDHRRAGVSASCARPTGRPARRRRPRRRRRTIGRPDLGGLAAGAEVPDLPAALPRDVPQGAVRVDRDGGADHRQHRHVVHRVRVGGASPQVQTLPGGQRADRGRLGLAVQHLAEQPSGVDAVHVLRDGAERTGQPEPAADDLRQLHRRRGDQPHPLPGVQVPLRQFPAAGVDLVGHQLVVDLLAELDDLGRRCRPATNASAPSRAFEVSSASSPIEPELHLQQREPHQVTGGEEVPDDQAAGEMEDRRALHHRVVDVEEGRGGQVGAGRHRRFVLVDGQVGGLGGGRAGDLGGLRLLAESVRPALLHSCLPHLSDCRRRCR